MTGKVVLTACSDARKETDREEIEKLKEILAGFGFEVEESRFLYDDGLLCDENPREEVVMYSDEKTVDEQKKFSDEDIIDEDNLLSGIISAGRKLVGEEKAEELSGFFRDNDIVAIFDVSGGNVANELLSYLDYDAIASSSAVFFGYSDLTTIINTIYAKTGKTSVLYQARHLVGNENRQREFAEFLEVIHKFAGHSNMRIIPDGHMVKPEMGSNNDGHMVKPEMGSNNDGHMVKPGMGSNNGGHLVEPEMGSDTYENLNRCNFNNIAYRFLQGKELHGTLLGGNLRCFLKLAGTDYMPDVTDKVLLMEALGGDLYSARTMLAQLSQLGVFHKIRGIVVGTFTTLIREGEYDRFLKLLLDYIPNNMPVVVTGDIGHGADAKGIIIGEEINF